MLSLRVVSLLRIVFICLIFSCGEEDGSIQQTTQAIGYSGPNLKLPLWAPFKWYVTVPVGGKWGPGPNDYDPFHDGKDYHAIDFDDALIDSAGTAHFNVNGAIKRADGSEFYPKIIPAIAAADGIIAEVVSSGCSKGGKACMVLVEHKDDYFTYYLHLIDQSIPVSVGEPIKSGQVLGYVGTTGQYTSGTHLHFQLFKKTACSSTARPVLNTQNQSRCFNSSRDNAAFQGVTLEGRPWTDYKVGSFYPSTNGFSFNSASNPTLCQDAPTGSASTSWVYTCTPKSGSVKVKEAVFGLIGIEKIAHNFGWKAEVVNPTGTVIQTYQWDASGVDPWGWDRSYYWPWVYPDTPGKWELRYFVKTNDSFPTYPMAVLPFTVADAPPYTYNGNGLTCSDKPTGSAATNWVYTCKEPKSTFSSVFNPTVYGLLYVENIFKNFKFVTKVFNLSG